MSIYHTSSLTTIILAAGSGTRMKSSLPKVLHPVAGKPMLRHVIDAATQILSDNTIVVVNAAMQPYYDAIETKKSSFHFVVQPKQLGTADAVKIALSRVTDKNTRILILYGDTPLITPKTLKKLMQVGGDISVLGFHAADPTGYGRLITNRHECITSIVEEKDATASEKKIDLCHSGILTAPAELLQTLLQDVTNQNAAGEYYLTDIIALAVAKKLTCRYMTCGQEELIGVNDRHQLLLANQLFQLRKAYDVIEQGATLIAPETVFFSHDTSVGTDVTIHPYVTFGPGVSIGNNTVIHSFSHIEGADIGNHCSIGPFARLRPGTELESDVKIGNFVEVKQAHIGKSSKVNHLSYIGDAILKERVNIGAGTITCNYDGFKKSQTFIEADVFVGSNTALVAPVAIGEGAIIGAGSTIVEDVPADAMALARSKQQSIASGAVLFKEKQAKALLKEKKDTSS